jgi:hypothetical protein
MHCIGVENSVTGLTDNRVWKITKNSYGNKDDAKKDGSGSGAHCLRF